MTSGLVPDDPRVHGTTGSLPPYALCGAGAIAARSQKEFRKDDPQACPVCASLVSHDDAPEP